MTLRAPKPQATRAKDDKAYNQARGTSKQQGYDETWNRLSRQHRKQEPVCRQCLVQHRTTPATCVDHIVPFNGPDDPKRLDPINLQALCPTCHEYKTWRERAGYIADWVCVPRWYVISGKPCSGKSWLMGELSIGHAIQHPNLQDRDGILIQLTPPCHTMTWDMDEVSRAKGFMRMDGDYHHAQWQLKALEDDRAQWVERVEHTQPDVAILIAANMITAFNFAKRLRANLVHCWVDEDERQRRIAERGEVTQTTKTHRLPRLPGPPPGGEGVG